MSIPNRKKLRKIVLTLLLVAALLLLTFVGCGQTAAENESETTAAETVNAPETPQNGAGEREDETLVDSPEASKAPAELQETADSEKTETTSQTAETPTPSTAASTPIQTPAPTAGTTPTPTQTPAPVSATSAPESTHVHDWRPVYTTVHHDAVTEEIKVIDQEATEPWTETVRTLGARCRCGAWFATSDGWWSHADSMPDEEFEAHSSWADSYNETTVYHEGTPEISHYETVIVTPAYDEQVIDHYVCSCGEIKPA